MSKDALILSPKGGWMCGFHDQNFMRGRIVAAAGLTDNGAIAISGGRPVQFLIEIMAAAAVWAATLVFAQFGIEIDLTRPAEARQERTVQRTSDTAGQPAPGVVNKDCPDANKGRIHRI